MRSAALSYLAAAALALLHASFFTAFSHPVSLVNLPLMLVVTLAVGLRSGRAVGVALIAGLVMDVVSAAPMGACVLAMTAAALIVVLSLSTVLTHLSFAAFLGANAAAFLSFHLLIFLVTAASRSFSGGAFWAPEVGGAFTSVMIALPVQLAVCTAARLASGRWRRRRLHAMPLR